MYISVIRYGKTESNRVKADYLEESSAPLVGDIFIVNNAVISDTVTVELRLIILLKIRSLL